MLRPDHSYLTKKLIIINFTDKKCCISSVSKSSTLTGKMDIEHYISGRTLTLP